MLTLSWVMMPWDWIGMVTIRSDTRRSTSISGTISRRPGSRPSPPGPGETVPPARIAGRSEPTTPTQAAPARRPPPGPSASRSCLFPSTAYRMRDCAGSWCASALVGVDVGRAEHLRVAQVEAARVGHQAAQLLQARLVGLGRRLLFEALGVLLGGEIHDLGEVTWPVGVLGQRHSQDVRRFPGQDLPLVALQADHPFQVVAMALGDPDEAGLVGAAIPVQVNLGGIMDSDPSKVLGGVSPPLALLGPVAVAASLGLGGEADHGDAPAVLGDPRRGAQPAVGAGGKLSLPAAQIPADSGWVGRPALDDPNKHALC